jgi:F-type H+-transporting ATPase subunit a
MKPTPGSALGLLHLAAACLLLGASLAVGADAPGTVPAQSGTALVEADVQKEVAKVESQAVKEEHGLPQAAVPLHKGGFPITNSMVVTWIVAVLIILAARRATRRMEDVPSGAQNFWEWLVESLYEFLGDIVGSKLVRKTFWFFATVFIFLLSANWFGLLPGIGSVGWGHDTEHGFVLTAPLLRGVNADLNMTFGIGMIFFALWTLWAFQVNGAKGFFLELFGPKGDMTGILKLLMIVIFFLSGVLEVVSILFRPVSLGCRLYGNIFAGENMLESMSRLVPEPAWLNAICSVVIPLPFYFLEVLVGLVQALVFMLLTAVFTVLICQHDEAHTPDEAQH